MTLKLTSKSVNYHFDVRRVLNGKTDYSASGSNSSTWQNGSDGGPVPNWRRKIKEGRSATSSLSGFETVRNRVPVNLTMHLKGPKSSPTTSKDYYMYTYADDGGAFTPSDPSLLVSLDADTIAREQFIKKYRQLRTTFQGGTFLGELHDVVRMIRHPAQRLRTEIDLQRAVARNARSRFRSPRAAIKAVKDSWLEFAFGVRPLVNDVQDALKLADALPERYRQPISAHGSVKGSSSSVSSTPAPGGITWPYYRTTVIRHSDVSVRYKGAVDGTNHMPSFWEQFGTSWSNVFPTAYELIPYSFLIDYFSNLGTVIEGISNGRVALSWGCRTVRTVCDLDLAIEPDNAFMKTALGSDYEWHASVNGGGKAGHRKTVTRNDIISVQLGLADFRFQVPAGASTKWLNIAALISMKQSDKPNRR